MLIAKRNTGRALALGLVAILLCLVTACSRSDGPDSAGGEPPAVAQAQQEPEAEAETQRSPPPDSPTFVARSEGPGSTAPSDISAKPLPTATVQPAAGLPEESPVPTTVEPQARSSRDDSLEGTGGGPAMSFTDVTAEAGINYVHVPLRELFGFAWPGWIAGGAVAEDFDGDGWIDLFILRGAASPALLYMNQGDGTFSNEAASRGAALTMENIRFAHDDLMNNREYRANPVYPCQDLVTGNVCQVDYLDDWNYTYTFDTLNYIVLEGEGAAASHYQCRGTCIYASEFLKQFHPGYADPATLAAQMVEQDMDNWVSHFMSKVSVHGPFYRLQPVVGAWYRPLA